MLSDICFRFREKWSASKSINSTLRLASQSTAFARADESIADDIPASGTGQRATLRGCLKSPTNVERKEFCKAFTPAVRRLEHILGESDVDQDFFKHFVSTYV